MIINNEFSVVMNISGMKKSSKHLLLFDFQRKEKERLCVSCMDVGITIIDVVSDAAFE